MKIAHEVLAMGGNAVANLQARAGEITAGEPEAGMRAKSAEFLADRSHSRR